LIGMAGGCDWFGLQGTNDFATDAVESGQTFMPSSAKAGDFAVDVGNHFLSD
jgi:hypothetical protein